MAAELGDIVNEGTIRKYVKSLDGFKTRMHRILPYLDAQAKNKIGMGRDVDYFLEISKSSFNR
eukprot:8454307-Ditylum_brightwellii.AAC.1